MGNLGRNVNKLGSTRFHRRSVTIASALIAMVAIVGCADVEPGPLVGEVVVEVPADAIKVLALDNRFIPEIVTVPVGSTVVLVNGGRNEHNIIPARGGAGWGIDEQDFLRGESYEVAFPAAGNAFYYCDIHGDEFSGMIGEIIIEEATS